LPEPCQEALDRVCVHAFEDQAIPIGRGGSTASSSASSLW
jgi:hypothetical protein